MVKQIHAVKKAAVTPPPPISINQKKLPEAPAVKNFTLPPVKIDLTAVDRGKLEQVSANTQLDVEFLESLAKFEGVRPIRYKIDGGNTVGIGHFVDDDPQFKGKQDISLTQDEIYGIFTEDLLKKEKDIEKAVPNFRSLSKGKYEALVDLFFNSKPKALTGIIDAVSHGKFDEAVKKMAIIYSGKKVSPGLSVRRIETIRLFAQGDNPTSAKATILGIVAKAKGRKDVQLAAQKALGKLDEAWALKQNPQKTPVVASNR